MFVKKCPKCDHKVKKGFDFCPFCGNDLRSNYDKEDYGLIGKNDVIDNIDPMKSFQGSFMEKILNNAMKELPSMIKMIEKQMNEQMNQEQNNNINPPKMPNNLNIQFFVNGKRVLPQAQEIKAVPAQLKVNSKFSKEKREKISILPREVPTSKVRRMSGKVIYELAVPGVDNIEDVLVNQLENSIEIKAISDEKVYSKTLNVKLPILGYNLKEGNLVLELQAQ
jgi:hypothetical protein